MCTLVICTNTDIWWMEEGCDELNQKEKQSTDTESIQVGWIDTYITVHRLIKNLIWTQQADTRME